MSPEERDIARVNDSSVSENEVVEIFNRIDEFSEQNKKALARALMQYWIAHGKWTGKVSDKQKNKIKKITGILEEG